MFLTHLNRNDTPVNEIYHQGFQLQFRRHDDVKTGVNGKLFNLSPNIVRPLRNSLFDVKSIVLSYLNDGKNDLLCMPTRFMRGRTVSG